MDKDTIPQERGTRCANAAVALLPVLAFLAALVLMDSFKRVPPRAVARSSRDVWHRYLLRRAPAAGKR